jgi:hypothetical protein
MKGLRWLLQLMIVIYLFSNFTANSASDSIVSEAQERLTNLGYDPGPIDGSIGPKTKTSIKRFQTDNGLPETGQLDEVTIKALRGKKPGAKRGDKSRSCKEIISSWTRGGVLLAPEDCFVEVNCPKGKKECSQSEMILIPVCLRDGKMVPQCKE